MGLPQSSDISRPLTDNSQHSFIFGIIGFLVIYAILHFLVNNQRKKVKNGLEKINLRENPDRNVGGMM